MTDKARFRLFVDLPLAPGFLTLGRQQSHYIATVMRARVGQAVALFNGRDGQWTGRLTQVGKATVELELTQQTRPQTAEPDLWLLAAPIKKDRIDLVAEKATELGVSVLWPVLTRRTVMGRVNTDRLTAHLIEAAEQCERLTVPRLLPPQPLDKALADWDETRLVYYLDESGAGQPLARLLSAAPPGRAAILVGPEGGFDPHEQAWLRRLPFVRPVGLGPRILRAETAALAALTLVQALAGDWDTAPSRPL